MLQVFRQCCLGRRLCSLGLSSRGLLTIDRILSNGEVQVRKNLLLSRIISILVVGLVIL